jgi:hypothetical protein
MEGGEGMHLSLHIAWTYLPIAIRSNRYLIGFITLFYINLSPIAGELEELSVTVENGDYGIQIVMVMDAPADYVYRVITDYEHAYRINHCLTESVILSSPDEETVRVYNHSVHCIWLFCFDIDWVGDIVELQAGHLKVDTLPEYSSFDSGLAVWRIHPQGERTWLFHNSHFKPDFFIPPLIGEHILKQHMRDETLDTFKRIECHAKILLKRDMENKTDHLKTLVRDGRDCIHVKG